MSSFRSPKFVKEFAYRTKINYYNLVNYKPDEINHTPEKVTRLLKEMEGLGFDTSQKYEVTLAINSLIGLLIFPQQQYYEELVKDVGFDGLPKLKSCIDNDKSYKNTYKEYERIGGFRGKTDKRVLVPEDANKPANILRHMRNAVSHERIGIVPESGDGNTITHLRFIDSCSFTKHQSGQYSKNEKATKPRNNDAEKTTKATKSKNGDVFCEFDLQIPVESLEDVIMEIADYLIGFDTK